MEVSWPGKNQSNQYQGNYEHMIVTHDLQDCFDETLDLCLDKIYNQLPAMSYTKISQEIDTVKSENGGKADEDDGNTRSV